MLAEDVSKQLKALMEGAVRRNLAESILLSGGLDTSIVTLAASDPSRLTGITVSLGEAPDIMFASLIAKRFGLRHHIVRVDNDDVEAAIPEVVRVMESFDPMEVRNDATILIGLRKAKEEGFGAVMTGDAGDELFAGYSFFFKMSRAVLEKRLSEIWATMRFSSMPLAQSLGMKAKLPFLDDEFKSFAMQIDVGLKIREERGRTYGKWILRKAFEQDLPEEIIWRVKMPIEQGSGTSSLPNYYAKWIDDSDFSRKKDKFWEMDRVRIRDKEQLAYYQIYRELFGTPAERGDGEKLCPGCSTRLVGRTTYCRTCGEYPV